LGNYEDGCVWAAQALQKYANALYLVPLIMNAQRAGRKEEARNAANRLLHFAPNFRAPDVVSFRKIEYEENALEALREAGLRV
jgi:hypothetical protein